MIIKMKGFQAAAPIAAALLLLTACKGSSNGGIIAGPTPPPSNGSVYLTDSNSVLNEVLVFPQNTNGGPAPTLDISGNVTGLSSPQGIAVDNAGNMWVTNTTTSTITEYSAGSTGKDSAREVLRNAAVGTSFPPRPRRTRLPTIMRAMATSSLPAIRAKRSR